MYKRRKTTVTGDDPTAEITKQLNNLQNPAGNDSDPDFVGVGEPKDSKK